MVLFRKALSNCQFYTGNHSGLEHSYWEEEEEVVISSEDEDSLDD
jgi:hypothetical protein